jgi:tetratricopeptide (TPR) repeat protein
LDNSFALSLENFAIARKKWTEEEGVNENTDLFLLFSEGQVYESANREDFALQKYIQCKSLVDKLPYSAPDKAIPYCGMGSVFFNMEEYEMALRCFLMAR